MFEPSIFRGPLAKLELFVLFLLERERAESQSERTGKSEHDYYHIQTHQKEVKLPANPSRKACVSWWMKHQLL